MEALCHMMHDAPQIIHFSSKGNNLRILLSLFGFFIFGISKMETPRVFLPPGDGGKGWAMEISPLQTPERGTRTCDFE